MYDPKTGKYFLELQVLKSLGHRYEAGDRVLTDEEVAPFQPSRPESSRQETQKPIVWRDYALENILTLTIDGETYTIG